MSNPSLSNASLSRNRQRGIMANAGLARKLAWIFAENCNEPFEELYTVAMAGLTVAYDRFNWKSGNAFSSYAYPWIKGEILHYLRDERKQGGVNAGRKHKPKFFVNSLDIPAVRDEESAAETFKDQLEDLSALEALNATQTMVDITEAIDRLPERQKTAIRLRFFEGLSQKQIAPIIKRNEVSVSRIIRKGLKTLAKDLKEYH